MFCHSFRLLLLFSGLDLEEGDGNMNFRLVSYYVEVHVQLVFLHSLFCVSSISFKDNLWKVVDGLTNFKKRIVESLSHHSIR